MLFTFFVLVFKDEIKSHLKVLVGKTIIITFDLFLFITCNICLIRGKKSTEIITLGLLIT